MPERQAIELHFREGFDGQQIEVMINGRPVAAFTARTRMQIGLAHVEKLEIEESNSVVVRIGGAEKPVPVVKGVIQYAIDLREGVLSIKPARDRLRYL